MSNTHCCKALIHPQVVREQKSASTEPHGQLSMLPCVYGVSFGVTIEVWKLLRSSWCLGLLGGTKAWKPWHHEICSPSYFIGVAVVSAGSKSLLPCCDLKVVCRSRAFGCMDRPQQIAHLLQRFADWVDCPWCLLQCPLTDRNFDYVITIAGPTTGPAMRNRLHESLILASTWLAVVQLKFPSAQPEQVQAVHLRNFRPVRPLGLVGL